MRRRITTAIGVAGVVVALLAPAGPVQAEAQIRWSAEHSVTDGPDAAFDIALSPDAGSVYVTGTVTIAYDSATGSELWVAPPGGRAIAVSGDGSMVFVSQVAGGAPVCGGETTALDSETGLTLWSVPFGGLLTSDPVGSALYVGNSATSSFWPDCQGRLIALNPEDGVVRWQRNLANDVSIRAIEVSPDGRRVFAAGSQLWWDDYACEEEGLPGGNMWIATFRAVGGSRVWDRTISAPGSSVDGTSSLALSPSGDRAYLYGDWHPYGSSCWGRSAPRAATLTLRAATGQEQEVAVFNHRNPQIFGCEGGSPAAGLLAIAPSGRALVHAGIQSGDCKSTNIVIVASDTRGNVEWSREIDLGSDDRPLSVLYGPQGGRVYVGGVSGDSVFVTSLSKKNGSRQWLQQIPGADFGAMGVGGPDPSVFIAGSTGGPDSDMLTASIGPAQSPP
ncbi:MAG: PQQ-binding-like beta-propeller repeat protein [Actinomycetota bacterium]